MTFSIGGILSKTVPDDILARMKKIRLFASDIDGVMTDSGMYYSEHGDELKKFNTRDGGGFMLMKLVGIPSALITSEHVRLVQQRAKKLKIDHLFQVKGNKLIVLKRLLKELNLELENVAYIGDDINDITMMENVGLGFAVRDAVEEIRSRAHWILEKGGGEGAVREAAELILKNTGQYDTALQKYLDQKRFES